MRRPTGRQRRLVILTLAVLAFGLAYYSGSRYKNRPKDAPPIAGVTISPPAPLPEVTQRDDSPLRPEQLSGHWTLLMLDPQAADLRSPALTRLLRVHNRLAGDPDLQHKLHYRYLPREIAPAEQEAIDQLGDNIEAVAGSSDQLAELLRQFGVEPGSETPALYLVGPETGLHALFTPDQDTATIAEDLTTLIKQEP